MDRSAIDKYEAQADVPAHAIVGLSREELLANPVPGTWNIQQVILHLMDADLVGSDRMKRVIAEPAPTLLAYDETLWATHLTYDRADVAMACEVFRLNRKMTAAILRRLPDEAFRRTGHHTERGVETLADLVAGYVEHVTHHLRFVREKRARLGKPMD